MTQVEHLLAKHQFFPTKIGSVAMLYDSETGQYDAREGYKGWMIGYLCPVDTPLLEIAKPEGPLYVRYLPDEYASRPKSFLLAIAKDAIDATLKAGGGGVR